MTVRAIEAGTLTGREVALTSSLATATAAEVTLTVDAADAPGFARVFLPDTIKQGGETEIVFTVDNGANAIGMTGMAFDDSLPSGISVADTPGVGNSCGGTFSPVAGATTLSFAAGVLAAGATCELRVTVRAIEAGTLTGREVALTSSLATATAAEATLTVDAAAPGFARVFSPDTIRQGGETEIIFTVDNGANAIGMTEMAFDDSLPSGVSVADTPGADNSCGGAFSPVADATLSFAAGVLAAGATCELRVTVRAIEAGTLTGREVALTSSLATATAAEATLTVDLTPPAANYAAPTTLTVGVEITAITPAGPSAHIAADGYAASGLSAGLTINANTGIISGAPTTAGANPTTATITLADTAGNEAEIEIPFPAVGRGAQTLAGFAYSVATATAGDTLTLTAPTGAVGALSYGSSDPAICTVDSGAGALSLLTAGACTITVTAAQTANYNEATASFTITVNAVGAVSVTLNDPIAGDNIVNIAEQRDGFAIGGTVAATAAVSVTIGGGSARDATVSGAIWSLAIAANDADITGAEVEIVVTATLIGMNNGEARRTLTVDLTAPTATWTAPATLTVGTAITDIPVAGPSADIPGANGYAATDLPAGLVINANTGAINGAPTTAETNPATATITLTDTAGNEGAVVLTFPAVGGATITTTGNGGMEISGDDNGIQVEIANDVPENVRLVIPDLDRDRGWRQHRWISM